MWHATLPHYPKVVDDGTLSEARSTPELKKTMKKRRTCCPSEIAGIRVYKAPKRRLQPEDSARGNLVALTRGGPLRKSVKWIIHHFESADRTGWDRRVKG